MIRCSLCGDRKSIPFSRCHLRQGRNSYPSCPWPQATTIPTEARRPERGGKSSSGTSWDKRWTSFVIASEALSKRYGSQAVLPLNYAGRMGCWQAIPCRCGFFTPGRLLADSQPVCAAASAAQPTRHLRRNPRHPPPAGEPCQNSSLLGNNATVCNSTDAADQRGPKRNGAKLVVVDPRRVKVAEQAQLYLPVVPEPTWCWRGQIAWSWRDWAASTAPS